MEKFNIYESPSIDVIELDADIITLSTGDVGSGSGDDILDW